MHIDQQHGRTLFEMLTHRDQEVTVAATAPAETKPEHFNPLGVNLSDVCRMVLRDVSYRFQIVEVDEFDRGSMGKIADYRMLQKADPNVPGSEAVDRYLRVFPGKTPDGKSTADLLLLTWLFDKGFEQEILDMLNNNEFPIRGDEYAGFVRNQGATLPYEAKVTEVKIGEAPNVRHMKYWDFVRTKGNSFEVFFIEMDSETGMFDAYIAEPIPGTAVSFLKKQ